MNVFESEISDEDAAAGGIPEVKKRRGGRFAVRAAVIAKRARSLLLFYLPKSFLWHLLTLLLFVIRFYLVTLFFDRRNMLQYSQEVKNIFIDIIKNKNMKKDKKIKTGRFLAEKILSGSLSASTWIFCLLIDLGELTVESFLNPSYYADLPDASSRLFLNDPIMKKKDKFKKFTIKQSVRRLKKMGFIERKENKFMLTPAGKIIAKYIINRKKIMRKKWDGKYRLVIFDIPEKNRKIRNWLREELALLDYKKLQKSVFISKFSLTGDLIKEIKRKKIGNCVNYLLVDKVYKNIL